MSGLKDKYLFCISSFRETSLSDTLKFSWSDIKGWLERETGQIFLPVHAKAQRLSEEMRKSLENLAEVSRQLLDNSGKEIERRNMKTYGRARALNRLARLFFDRTRQIKTPEKVTYASLESFVQEAQKAFTVTEIDIRNFFPRISPFFILDRRKFLVVFEKAKESLRELENFLEKDYVKTKTLEDTFQLVDKLSVLERQRKNFIERKAKLDGDKVSTEKEMADTQQKVAELKSMGGMGRLSQTGTEIEGLSLEIKQRLQHLQKPFIKLQALATHGSGSGLTPEELKKLNQYAENPFEAFSTEEAGYPLLKQILVKVQRAVSEDKLKLKPEKARKAQQAVSNILSIDSLADLHRRCKDAVARRTQLSTSEEVAAMQQNLAKLSEHVENLSRTKEILEAEEIAIQRNRGEIDERIRSFKSEMEKNILGFTGKKVTVS